MILLLVDTSHQPTLQKYGDNPCEIPPWNSMEIHGNPWKSMEIDGIPWK